MISLIVNCVLHVLRNEYVNKVTKQNKKAYLSGAK